MAYHPNQLVPAAVDTVTGLPVPLQTTGGILQTSATLTGNITMNAASVVAIGNSTSNVTQLPLSAQPNGTSVALVTISAIHGRLSGGGYNDVAVDSNGNLSINTTGLAQEAGNLSAVANNTLAISTQMTNGSQKASILNQMLNVTVAPQLVAVGTASAASGTVSASALGIVINPTVDTWVNVATTPVAAVNTTGNIFLAAGTQSFPISVTPSTTKVAAIANNASQAGWITITEMK